jgi:cytochrome c peroxidase
MTKHSMVLALLCLTASAPSGQQANVTPLMSKDVIRFKHGLTPLPEPNVDMTKVALGRRLFFDTRLSGDGTLSCVSCHSFDHGGAERRATSLGISGAVGPINSPTVLNASLNFAQFWDGRAGDLREQARGPVTNPIEMGSSFERVVTALAADPTYVADFRTVYTDGITETNIVDAIAEYESALITPAPFDRFLRGDETALSADERAGYELFTTVGCTSCHGGASLGGTMYQRLGLVREYFGRELGRPLTEADNGRFNVTLRETDRHRFKVPTLRNVALTAPYLHDGSQATLDEAVLVMGSHQLGQDLEPEQVRLVVAFLGALTGTLPEYARAPDMVTLRQGQR